MNPVLVLRPEPGNARTVARLEAAGFRAHPMPLFAVRPLAWTVPDPAGYDALLLTSANAPRFAGENLQRLRRLPVVAVGEATAAAARRAGLSVAVTGTRDAVAAAADAGTAGFGRLLHLAGREHVALSGVDAIAVYASEEVILPPGALAAARARMALLHSARAASRFAVLAARDGLDRRDWTLAALSPAVAAAAGGGWDGVLVAAEPTDAALLRLLSAG